MRALLRLKRKSKTITDENEDGQRAGFLEEGIITLIFQRALRLNYFEDISTLDYPLLKLIPEFVKGYEVEKCKLWEWERAILEGFRVFREFRNHRSGVVIVNLHNRSVDFEKFSGKLLLP